LFLSNHIYFPKKHSQTAASHLSAVATRSIGSIGAAGEGKGGLHCFFHPPPRSWARNAEA
jgi:hypothetical protein